MICRKAVLSRGKSSGKCSFERLAHGIVVPFGEDWTVENAAGFIKVTVLGRPAPASVSYTVAGPAPRTVPSAFWSVAKGFSRMPGLASFPCGDTWTSPATRDQPCPGQGRRRRSGASRWIPSAGKRARRVAIPPERYIRHGSRIARARRRFASSSPTNSSVVGFHFSERPSRNAMIARCPREAERWPISS